MDTVITPDQARQLLQEEQQARVNEAKREFDEFLAGWQQRHRCRLDIAMILRAGQVIPQVQIVAET